MKRIEKASLVLLIILVISACTTQKSKNDVSKMGMLWHNTTAHYNGYFNANELMIATTEQLNDQHIDNYNKVLKVYPYMAAENPQAVAADLDKAIEKVSVVVNLHRVSVWTDDCYLLVGQAQFLKKDYEGAEETFRYLVNEFDPADAKKKASKKKGSSSDKSSGSKTAKEKSRDAKQAEKERKQYNKQVKKNRKKKKKSSSKKKKSSSKKDSEKEKEQNKNDKKEADKAEKEARKEKKEELKAAGEENQPDNYFMKHRPIHQDGKLWLAKTLIERDNYDGAERYMAELEADPKIFDEVRAELSVLKGYYYMKRKNIPEAIVYLEQSIELLKDRKRKARYAFIIAQLYEDAGQDEKAYATFQRVLKFGPDYEMEFAGKLYLAQKAWLGGEGTPDDARRNLERMLKDTKNELFKDQIYYAMAEIDLEENLREDAIRNLELSLRYSRQNRAQKAEAYYTLAHLYFEVEDYVPAKNYFDSTLQVLSNTDERYNNVLSYSNNLTDIAKNIETITLMDSLLRISKLSEEERRALAFDIKKQRNEQKRRELASKANAAANPGSGKFNRSLATASKAGPGALQAKSTFFAYDDRNVKRGKRNFLRDWGGRPLEDDWRRSNRQSISNIEDEDLSLDVPESAITEDEIGKILSDVPTTDEAKEKAHEQIRQSMFALGSLYRDRLDNNEKAVEILEELNQRYPGSNYELDSWYFLYLSHSDLKNTAKAQAYKNKIIEKYPNSTYAKVLIDPSYAQQMMDEEAKLNVYYNEAYSAFTSGNYKAAFDKSNGAKDKFGVNNALQPRFALLSAMCQGNLQGKDAYVKALKEVIAKYPDSEEQTRAKEILRLLGESSAKLPGQAQEDSGEYKVEDEKLHYIIIVFDDPNISLTDNKAKVSDFNRKYHKLDKLRISNIYLGANVKTPIIVVRRFKDKATAMKYYDGIQKNAGDFIQADISHKVFAVTQNNYRQILRTKSVGSYEPFFDANYKN